MLELKGKTALITGASSGIGFGIAQELVNSGCKVIIVSKSKQKINLAAKKIIDSIPLHADLSCPIKTKALLKDVKSYTKKIDILVCNVGNSSSSPPGIEKYKDWKKMFDLNFFTTTNVIENFKDLISKNSGSIICISSICGIDYIPGAPITYSVAKAALNQYIKLSARVFSDDGIRINGIAPGNILFEGSVWDVKKKNNPKEVKKMLDNNVALKRLGTVSEVSKLALFLSSNRSSFITGSIIPADGGQLR